MESGGAALWGDSSNRPKQSARGAAEGAKVPAQRLWPVFPSASAARGVQWPGRR